MIRYLSLREVLVLHERVAAVSGGGVGVRDLGLLESAVAQPIVEKAVALGFSLISNHPFVDGNKRVGHAALEVFLLLNGFELDAPVDDQERIVLGVASGEMTREEFARWVDAHACDAT